MNEPNRGPRKKANLFVQCFDVSFVMVLCFVTLLATMVLHGTVLVGSGDGPGLDLTFHAPIFLLVVAVFGLYLWYMLRHSERELKEIVDSVYGKKTDKGKTER